MTNVKAGKLQFNNYEPIGE